jgi:hypothetical protein
MKPRSRNPDTSGSASVSGSNKKVFRVRRVWNIPFFNVDPDTDATPIRKELFIPLYQDFRVSVSSTCFRVVAKEYYFAW